MIDKKQCKKFTAHDFEKAFGEKLSQYVKGKIRKYNFQYRTPTPQERDKFIKIILDVLFDKSVEKAGKFRRLRWENGWNENLNEYNRTATVDSITPMYFGKHNCIRWSQDFIIPTSKNFEVNSLALILDWLSDIYLRKTKFIYEFGCGTGHNLIRLRDFNQKADLWGLDWAIPSQKLIGRIRQTGLEKNIHSHNFDFFKPDDSFELKSDGVVVTIAALEQVGDKFDKFMDYLIKKKPKLCIHVEPIYELLDENNLLDFLSIKYIQKRNYLWGLLRYMRKQETAKKAKIVRAQRTYIGSLFIDGYSVIVWQPL